MYKIHTVEDYSVLKGKDILLHAATWVSLQDVVLSEISRSQRDSICIIPRRRSAYGSQTQRQQVAWRPGSGQWGKRELFGGYRVSDLQGGNVLGSVSQRPEYP